MAHACKIVLFHVMMETRGVPAPYSSLARG